MVGAERDATPGAQPAGGFGANPPLFGQIAKKWHFGCKLGLFGANLLIFGVKLVIFGVNCGHTGVNCGLFGERAETRRLAPSLQVMPRFWGELSKFWANC